MPVPRRVPVLHRTSPHGRRSQSCMSATAASTLRERLDRLSGAPRRRPHPALYTPRGFEAVATPYGDALMRQDVLAPAFGLATFNGGSFDLPVLRTRWVMARMNGELDHPRHVDLLTLVRSLYRHRMEQCNLRTVEERLLGYEREDPVSGALAPE